MGYAKHIGRVGALAVTLGVGVALASAPTAFADSSGESASSGSSSSSSSADSSSSNSSTTAGSSSSSDSSDAGSSPSAGTNGSSVGSGPAGPASSGSDDDDDADGEADTESAVRAGAGDTDIRSGAQRRFTQRATTSRAAKVDALSADASSAVEPNLTLVAVAVEAEPQVNPEPVTPPAEAPVALAALAAVRDELERNTQRRNATSGPQIGISSVDTPNVLVIGVDGVNLSRVLADPANANFFSLIQGSSTAPSSIVGHTTISNPSWSTILTGAWGEKTGVINNVFTPWTYNKWPTVFNQLEEDHGNGIQTTAVANWDVIAAIAAAGGDLSADDIRFIAHVANDPSGC